MITTDKIIQLFEKYWDTLPGKFRDVILNWKSVGIRRPGVTPFEAFLLYTMVLEEEPKTLFEMGTREGSITIALAYAQQQRGRRNEYISTEIQDFVNEDRTRLLNLGLAEHVIILRGNGIVLAPEGMDMCVIDADHSYKFAQAYIQDLLPKCSTGCLVFAHDHIPYTQEAPNNDGQIDLAKDIKATPGHYEQRATKEFLLETGKPYCFTEAIMGGRHTPVNHAVRKAVQQITKVDLFREYKCPTSIFYRI